MRHIFSLALAIGLLLSPTVVAAQHARTEAEIRRAVPYGQARREVPGLTLEEYNDAVRELALESSREVPRSYWEPIAPPALRYVVPDEERSGTSYDWRSGNTYNWRKSGDGVTKVDGFNANTGSMWQTEIKPNGSMNGWDSDFNPWSYDARTKTYMNYGTGTICVGEGAARVCS